MPGEALRIVFEQGALRPGPALAAVQGVLEKQAVPLSGFVLLGAEMSFEAARQKIGATPGFTIKGQGWQFIHGSMSRHHLDFLTIRSETRPSWDDWAGAFIGLDDFVMAWAYDVAYDHWQNAKDPGEYAAIGKDPTNLPMRSNGLPHPLNRMEIDTSNNPGRFVLREGYIEAVGSPMWLGAPFWTFTGADRPAVMAARDLHPQMLGKVMKLTPANACFTRPDGAAGDMQNRLRSLLYRS